MSIWFGAEALVTLKKTMKAFGLDGDPKAIAWATSVKALTKDTYLTYSYGLIFALFYGVTEKQQMRDGINDTMKILKKLNVDVVDLLPIVQDGISRAKKGTFL